MIETMREKIVFQKKCIFCWGTNHYADLFLIVRVDNYKACATVDLDIQQSESTNRNIFRYVLVDNLIVKCPKTI